MGEKIIDDLTYSSLIRNTSESVLAKVALVFAVKDKKSFLEVYEQVSTTPEHETYSQNFIAGLGKLYSNQGAQNAVKFLRDTRNYDWGKADTEIKTLAVKHGWSEKIVPTLPDSVVVGKKESASTKV